MLGGINAWRIAKLQVLGKKSLDFGLKDTIYKLPNSLKLSCCQTFPLMVFQL